MFDSIRAFFAEIIDYAGLFPPADLPLDQALANYVRYRQGPESWMLGRFIMPAARLDELTAFGADIAPIAPLRLSVLGRGGKNAEEFLAHVRADLVDIGNLDSTLGDGAAVENYEAKLPASLFARPAPEFFTSELFPLLGMVRNLLDTSAPGELVPYFEFPPLEPAAVLALTARIQADEMRSQELLHDSESPEDRDQTRFPRPGWKLRCGGLDAAAFPTPRQVATVLTACFQAGIPWKATAGLHHPLRHFEAGIATPMHGFVNVFGAGILAHARLLDEAQMLEMLGDDDGSHFRFDEASFRWKSQKVTTDAIRSARKSFVTSFGSCSFAEPCDDLKKRGWL